jgi:hypothetical protein
MEIVDTLELTKLKGREWYLTTCDVLTGGRVREGFEWLENIFFK